MIDRARESPAGRGIINRIPLRWALLALLLGAELVALSMRIDTAALSHRTGLWVIALGHAGKLASVVVATLAAGQLLHGPDRVES